MTIFVALIGMSLGLVGFNNTVMKWPEYVPIAGGHDIAQGLVFLWLDFMPIVCILMPVSMWIFANADLRDEEEESNSMKLGR